MMTDSVAASPPDLPAPESALFELLAAYNRSRENMRAWLDEAALETFERAAIADAFQSEVADWFRAHGFCFYCNRPVGRCRC